MQEAAGHSFFAFLNSEGKSSLTSAGNIRGGHCACKHHQGAFSRSTADRSRHKHMRQGHVLESEVLTSQSRPGGSAVGQKCGQQMRLHHRQASLHRRPMWVGSAELNALTDMALLRMTQRPVSYATSPGRCGKVRRMRWTRSANKVTEMLSSEGTCRIRNMCSHTDKQRMRRRRHTNVREDVMWASCHSGLLTQLLYHLFRVCLWVKGSSKTHWLSGLSQMSPAVSSTLQSSTEASRSGTRAGPLAFALKHAHPRGPQITSLLTKVAEGFSSPWLPNQTGTRSWPEPGLRLLAARENGRETCAAHLDARQERDRMPESEARLIPRHFKYHVQPHLKHEHNMHTTAGWHLQVSASCQPACKAHMLQPYHARAWDLLLVSADGSVQTRDGHYRRDAAQAI